MIRKTILSISLALMASLAATALTVKAQVQAQNNNFNQGNVQPLAGVPTVQVTQVQNLGIIGDDATLVIETRWTATSPTLTPIVRFNLDVEVTYSDGSTNKGSTTVLGSERTARVRVLNKGGITPASFFAKLGTKFRRTETLVATREFGPIIPQTNLASPLGQTSLQNLGTAFDPAVNITKLEGASLCVPNKECVEVMWAISPRRQDPNPENRSELEGFIANVEVTYGDGTKKTGQQGANAQAREATVRVDKHAPVAGAPAQAGQVSRFKVKLSTRFSFPDFRTDTKQGNF